MEGLIPILLVLYKNQTIRQLKISNNNIHEDVIRTLEENLQRRQLLDDLQEEKYVKLDIQNSEIVAQYQLLTRQFQDLQQNYMQLLQLVDKNATSIHKNQLRIELIAGRLKKIKDEISEITNEKIQQMSRGLAWLQGDKQDEFQSNLINMVNNLKGHTESLRKMSTHQALEEKHQQEKEKLLQDPVAEKYFLDVTSAINAAYIAAQSVKSGFIDTDKKGVAGHMGEALKAMGDLLPLVGGVGAIIGGLLSGLDQKHQQSRIQNIANITNSSSSMEALAAEVTYKLLENKKHLNNNAEIHTKTILKTMLDSALTKVNFVGVLLGQVNQSEKPTTDRTIKHIREELEQQAQYHQKSHRRIADHSGGCCVTM